MYCPKDNKLALFFTILDYGKGSKMLKLVEGLGSTGSTVFLGRGTVRNELLNLVGIIESKKEVFITVVDENLEDELFSLVAKKFDMEKPQHGIAFSIPLKYYLTLEKGQHITSSEKKGGNILSHEAIFIIADKNYLDDILDAAQAGGSTGGTIIHGRGTGCHEKALLFNIIIEPEKIIVLILAKKEKTAAIVNSIEKKLNIDEPNTGIIFVMDVNRTLGLYEKKE